MKPTPEQIAKLPKWAQEHIEDIERQAFIAQRTLNEYHDASTPSLFYTDDYDSIQKKMVRRYIQTNRLVIERDGLKVELICRQDDPGVDITYSDESRLCYEVALVPRGFNHIRLMRNKDMRVMSRGQ